MSDGQFDALVYRLEFDHAARITFDFQLRSEFVAPLEKKALGSIRFSDFAGIDYAVIRKNKSPRRAW